MEQRDARIAASRFDAIHDRAVEISRELDELFEVLTLRQTQKIQAFPVVLFGTTYWQGLLDWLTDSALASGTVSAGAMSCTGWPSRRRVRP